MLGSVIFLCGGAWAQKPVAELPRVHVDTNWSEPTGGKTWTVHSVADFTNSLEKSSPGDVIVLDAGRVYAGNFTIPAKSNPNKKWIYVNSSGYNKLPAPGTRVSPSDSVNMPKIVTPNATNVLRFAEGSNYWRFVGVEIYSQSSYHPTTNPPGVNFGYALITKYCYPSHTNCTTDPSTVPDHIYFDRVYVHGDATHDLQEAFLADFTSFALFDSYVSDIHAKGMDTQAFGADISPGPFKLVNNYLEAAGENVMFGGSGRGWGGFVPSDIEVRNNYLFKPLSWVPLSLTGRMVVKNSFELKSAQRVLFDNNVIENKWAAGQVGSAVLITIRSGQSGDVAVVKDVTVTNNVIRNVVGGFDILDKDYTCGVAPYANCKNAGMVERIYIANNLVLLLDVTAPGGGTGTHTTLASLSPGRDVINGVVGQVHDVVIQHNTVAPYGNQSCWKGVNFSIDATWRPPFPQSATKNIWILDNVLCRQPSGDWGLQGTTGLTQYMGAPSTPPFDVAQRFRGNVMYVPPGDKIQSFPPHNLSTSKAFRHVDPTNGNFQLLEPQWTETTDGKPAGIDFTKLPK